jgi:hypothetical protein
LPLLSQTFSSDWFSVCKPHQAFQAREANDSEKPMGAESRNAMNIKSLILIACSLFVDGDENKVFFKYVNIFSPTFHSRVSLLGRRQLLSRDFRFSSNLLGRQPPVEETGEDVRPRLVFFRQFVH